jgi:hypothetical protein
MPLNPKLSNVGANAEADAVCVLANSGFLRLYDGTQATSADTALGAQVLLAELTFGNPAFGAASAGVATANAITQDSSANASGTCTWFRAVKSDTTTVLFDGSVGTSGCNLNLNSVAISSGAAVQVTSLTFTAQKG